ncbi:MAG TPA: hypothetical protein DIW43_04375 [Spongiibacteraceae bacterium]|nr:hypothetical protein [Spongiibacteraceae bacterium]HCS26663.1 hypothetical protein [Spongiibacteraceae bacterium]
MATLQQAKSCAMMDMRQTLVTVSNTVPMRRVALTVVTAIFIKYHLSRRPIRTLNHQAKTLEPQAIMPGLPKPIQRRLSDHRSNKSCFNESFFALTQQD